MKTYFTLLTAILLNSGFTFAQNEEPAYLKDRGTGQPTSMFGTYINKGEIILYPYYEYYYDRNSEYKPAELGYGLEQDFLSKSSAHEALIFLGYGITDRLAIEFEAAWITETLHKASDDPSSMPGTITESGLGDVEGQLRWRWNNESASKPEVFSFFEYVLPLQKNRKLIGTSVWELKLGTGLIKGFNWGTVTVRTALGYDGGEGKVELGEYGIEYLKRVSKFFRFAVIMEGTQDEVELITDLQFHVSPNAFIRVNHGLGITKKATDFAPEVGVLFHF